MTEQLDDTDQRLLSLLSLNARSPVASLAKSLGLARTTVQARLERLERRGVIAGYTLKVSDAFRRGQIGASVLTSIEPRSLPGLLRHLQRMAEVERVHTTSGRFDLLIQIRCSDTRALDDALDRIGELDGVRSIESLIHLSTRIDRAL